MVRISHNSLALPNFYLHQVLSRSHPSLWSCFGGCNSSEDIGSYQPLETTTPSLRAIGAVRVVVQAANINEKLFMPRPFVRIRIQGRNEVKITTLEDRT